MTSWVIRLSHSSFVAMAAVALSHCATMVKDPYRTVPERFRQQFSACYPVVQEATVKWQSTDENSATGDVPPSMSLDLNSENIARWGLDVSSPLGQALLSVDVIDQRIVTKGELAGVLPPLAIRQDEYLSVDGHFVGILAEEIPCLMAFRFPKDWLGVFTREARTESGYIAQFESSHRRVTYSIDTVDPVVTARQCATMEWSSWLGLNRQSMTWCQWREGGRWRGHLSGLGQATVWLWERP